MTRAARYPGALALTALLLAPVIAAPGPARAQGTTADGAIRLYQQMVRRRPGDARNYYRLGDAYVQKARESGDVAYFNLAEQALRNAIAIYPRYSDASRHLAFVLYSRHDFEGAAAQARKATELNPTDSHAWGILGDAYLEVGKYEQAQETYQRMIEIEADLYSLSRLSGLKSLRGDPRGAIEDLERAIQAGRANWRTRESIAWAQWQLGNEHFSVGQIAEAETQHLEALRTYPNYYRALASLAQVRVAQNRYEAAVDLYLNAIAIIPQPDFIAALGDVYTKLGRREDARKQYDLVEYMGHLSALNRVLYNRELAYFYADHDLRLEQALELARKELDYRHDVYAYDLLAWALLKNGHPRDAWAAITEALKLGTRDARLFFHAGMIRYCLGDTDEAREYLRRALATNPHFHVFFADVAAQTLAQLGESATMAQTKRDAR